MDEAKKLEYREEVLEKSAVLFDFIESIEEFNDMDKVKNALSLSMKYARDKDFTFEMIKLIVIEMIEVLSNVNFTGDVFTKLRDALSSISDSADDEEE